MNNLDEGIPSFINARFLCDMYHINQNNKFNRCGIAAVNFSNSRLSIKFKSAHDKYTTAGI